MKSRIKLISPRGGINDNEARSKQPAGTTPHAKNVRARDPGNARAQICQRPGYSNYTTSALRPGKKVDAIASVSVDLPKVEFLGPTRSQIIKKWGHLVPGLRQALAIDVDRQGNLYVLDSSGVFEKIGPDGEVENKTSFYVSQHERVIPRIGLDHASNVYVATAHPEGYSSRLIKFERLEDETFAEAWDYNGLWGIRDFRVGEGVAAIARHYAQTAEVIESNVVMLGALFAPEPIVLYEATVPKPISSIDITPNGEVLFSVSAEDNRAETLSDEGWNPSVVGWSPHEIGDVSGLEASTRIHFWLDADTLLDTYAEGAIVNRVLDRRWVDTTLNPDLLPAGAISPSGSVNYFPPTDLTPRTADKHFFNVMPGPLFRTKGAGTQPSLEFTGRWTPSLDWKFYQIGVAGYDFSTPYNGIGGGDNSLTFNPYKLHFLIGSSLHMGVTSPTQGNKSDTDLNPDGQPNSDGLMPDQRTPMVGHKDAVFCTFFVLRYKIHSIGGEVFFHHKSNNGIEYLITFNLNKATLLAKQNWPVYGQGTDGHAGKMNVFIGRGRTAERSFGTGTNGEQIFSWDFFAPSPIGADAAGVGTNYSLNEVDLNAAPFADPRQVLVVTLQQAGNKAAGLGHSLLRVNGVTIDRWTMTEVTAETATNGGAIFGTSTDLGGVQTATHLQAWRGHLMACCTLLGSTVTANLPNQVPVSWPGAPTAPRDAGVAAGEWTWIDETATPYASDSRGYTDAASVIERMEGYYAHKFGFADLLPSTVNVTTAGLRDGATTFMSTHPFGHFNGVARPPIGSPAAGGIVVTETGQALASPDEIIGKIGGSGEVQWALSGGGHGLGVKSGPDGSVFAVGRPSLSDPGVVARRLVDLGSTYRKTGDDTWEADNEKRESPRNLPVPGLSVDDADNLYWPREDELSSIRINFTVNAVNITTFSTSPVIPGAQGWFFSIRAVLPGVGSPARVVQLEATLIDTLTNLVAAINDSGDSSQYQDTAGMATGANPDWAASIESEETGGVISYFLRMTRKVTNATAYIITPGAANYPFSDIPPSAVLLPQPNPTSATLLLGADPRVEVRGAVDGKLIWEKVYTNLGARPLAVKLNPDLPLYPDAHELEGVPEDIYVGLEANVDANGNTVEEAKGVKFLDNLEALRQVERRQVIGADKSPRRTFHVATCDGDLFTIKKGKSGALVNNGSGVFNPESPFAKLFPYQGWIYGLDGQNYIRFDPKRRVVEEWKAEGAGKIPYGARVGCAWNGRIVLGRTADDPHNLHLSERGNPLGWDTDPSVLTALSAFSGAGTGTLYFRKNDLVNCLIPASDDLLIIGGDSSISRMTGDPGSGGQLDNLTESEGLAFGDAYALSPNGTVFVKGVQGGIWRISMAGPAERISLKSIERRLQDVDLNAYDIRMAWNFRQEGLHVFQVPKGAGLGIVSHWFWDAKENGWWEDEFSSTTVQPTSVAILDGDDPEDRVLAIGCEDGYVRWEDESASDDGGKRIVSEVVYGPLVPGSVPGRGRFSHLEVATTVGSDPLDVKVFTEEEPDLLLSSDPVYSGTAGPGYRGYNMFQATGNQVYVKVGNGAQGERWSLESMYIRARQSGRRKMF